jgi:hypothetical protein
MMRSSILPARRIPAYILSVVVAVASIGRAQVAVTTWHYDNARSGANSKETILTPSNVNSTLFGKLFTQPVDGVVVGQALYLPGISIPGAGVHNVVYVATMHDSVYAFDADNATPLWHTSFLINGASTIPIAVQGCGSTTQWTEVGILSTPVINTATGTLYVVANTYENSAFVHRLHALDVTTGLEKTGSPVVITASYGSDVFADEMQVNRPALLLEKGNLYIAFGSNGCRGDYEEGWVVSYNASTLEPLGAYDDEPGESAAAIWMRGGGLSADADGYIYGATADGPFMAGTNFGQSVLKLAQVGHELKLADWFTPFNEAYLDKHDLDMSEPVLILPPQKGKNRRLLAAVGKEGTIYLLNRENLGHFCSTCILGDSQIVQELPGLAPETGALVYWNNTIYATGAGIPIKALSLSDGVLSNVPVAVTKGTSQGHTPMISANGTIDGILWTTGNSLSAYNATTLIKIYSSSEAANGRDALPPLPHFANLMVANGKVYVGTNNSLVIFGLL